ncbi:MAG: hypothetical protein IJ471_02910 [Eubacterium sp.]|nr:hypothetical protein [Eubacterium sp.]
MTVTAIRIICCALYGAASYFDEKERQIPRILSLLACLCAGIGWGIQYFMNRQFVPGNLVVSFGFFGVLVVFWLKGQIGLGDLFLVASMLVLLSNGQPTFDLLRKVNMLLCIAFFSAAIRLLVRRVRKDSSKQPGCPFAIHLSAAFLIVSIC